MSLPSWQLSDSRWPSRHVTVRIRAMALRANRIHVARLHRGKLFLFSMYPKELRSCYGNPTAGGLLLGVKRLEG